MTTNSPRKGAQKEYLNDLIEKIKNIDYKISQHIKISIEAKDLIIGCLTFDPTKTFKELHASRL